MAIIARTEVKKVLLLEFELPGVTWTGHGGAAQQSQLQQKFGESWQMQVTPQNAIETADTLRQLADAIVQAMK